MCHLWNIYKFISYYCRCCSAAQRFSPLVFIAAATKIKYKKKILQLWKMCKILYITVYLLWDCTVSSVVFRLQRVSCLLFMSFSYFCDLRRMFSCHCYNECFRIALCTRVFGEFYLNRNYATDLAFNLCHIRGA